ncbi:MAG TPA: methyltransferase domain-containing protein [Candidatus Acidoferrales bacterium]|nr:methyltransferase domain-containing protein [Candidatus Acidoferrales bacterium]
MSNRIEWDSESYDKLSDPQFNWGMRLMSRLELRGNETVMDAGCGSGRLTAELLSRLPNGRVVAADYSENMLRTAHDRLAAYGDRVRFVHADLADLPFVREVDGIFSNAVFHWVPDHDAMFRSLFRSLKPGGWLLAQFGGKGNLSRLRARLYAAGEREGYSQFLSGYRDAAHFEGEEITRERMASAGFVQLETELFEAPVQFPSLADMMQFVKTVNAHQIITRLPEDIADRYLAEALAEAANDNPPFTLDYVRLTVRARRP